MTAPTNHHVALQSALRQEHAFEDLIWNRLHLPINYGEGKGLHEFFRITEFTRSRIRLTEDSVSTILLSCFGGGLHSSRSPICKISFSNFQSPPWMWVLQSRMLVTSLFLSSIWDFCFGIHQVQSIGTLLIQRGKRVRPWFLVKGNKINMWMQFVLTDSFNKQIQILVDPRQIQGSTQIDPQ